MRATSGNCLGPIAIKAIAASKTAGPARLLAALSIQGIGVQTAKAIVNKYRGFKGIEAVERPEDFAVVDGIGKILAENLFHFFQRHIFE